jgi:DNA segregation ATPase FtsK/SpoIIIE, S-DNA-T family
MAERIISIEEEELLEQPVRRRRSDPGNRKKEDVRPKKFRAIIGVLIILFGVYVAITLFSYTKWDPSLFTYTNKPVQNYGGIVGAHLSDLIFSFVGLTGYFFPLFLIGYGIKKIMGAERNLLHLTGFALMVPALSMLAELISQSTSRSLDPSGGLAGQVLTDIASGFLSVAGAYICCVALLSVSFILVVPWSVFSMLAERGRGLKLKKKGSGKDEDEEGDEAEDEPVFEIRREAPVEFTMPKPKPANLFAPRTVPERKDDTGYRLPPLDFLRDVEPVPVPTKEELTAAAAGLERKLADFGVSGKIRQAHPGPVVTMLEFDPAPGVKINRIVSLADDLALSLRAPSIRVYPIAGKATIGLEVPNRHRASVALKEIISSESFQKSSSLLTLALGKDIFGNPIVTDLARMPHLLVAGATGSGKSVSINAMITSILYKATPREVQMLMIDPKLLELSAYYDIPHLISPVITNPKEASEALKKMVFEMERRYLLLAASGVRNIESYNRQVQPSERMPYIVVFIDELADLMFTAPSDVETAIARLAQMARACGIHLILATQRPSVDVITGLIKANFPARISFQVTSKIDSRTILDAMGAEKLLGMGDMLFMVPGVKSMRIHGAFISDVEVKDITGFVKEQGKPDYSSFENITAVDGMADGDERAGDRDETYDKVIEFAESAGEVSISSIQRRFKIGYNKAANIMELLEEDGFVGPPRGAGKPRTFIMRRRS